jgi:hypothetical protein
LLASACVQVGNGLTTPLRQAIDLARRQELRRPAPSVRRFHHQPARQHGEGRGIAHHRFHVEQQDGPAIRSLGDTAQTHQLPVGAAKARCGAGRDLPREELSRAPPLPRILMGLQDNAERQCHRQRPKTETPHPRGTR